MGRAVQVSRGGRDMDIQETIEQLQELDCKLHEIKMHLEAAVSVIWDIHHALWTIVAVLERDYHLNE